MCTGLKIFNVKWTSTSAGPSPDNNQRTEIFVAGCKIAQMGTPCKGCFNPGLWSSDKYVAEATPEEVLEKVKEFAPNKYITFVGGEPLDQAVPLSQVIKLLKENGYHVIVITHYDYDVAKMMLTTLPDIIIDGAYDETQRIWDESKAGDGFHDVIGSGNQTVVDVYNDVSVKAKDLEGLYLDDWNRLVFITKEQDDDERSYNKDLSGLWQLPRTERKWVRY